MADAAATHKNLDLPEEREHEYKQQNDDVPASSLKYLYPERGQTVDTPRRTNFFPFWQLNALIIMVVLAASGTVSGQDFAFVLFSIAYIFFLHEFSFPPIPENPSQEPPVFNPENKSIRLRELVAALLGIVLPIAYILDGFLEGDKEGIRAAAPHVFLLASQVFMDGVAFSDRFSTPIRVFVPVLFNAKRIFTLVDWVRKEFDKGCGDGGSRKRRVCLGRGLAVANLVFWTYDLFGILLPIYLPRAFKKYYSAAKRE